ncbi:K02A2.6-like [Cordylochernes scorpioides]|uniref:RNA-directed DNA polymerase n=1 Tax=Cordylochernes scorpioides TaxID=51811 RepID=A0ABY6LFH4_9ARAC|nr:K02A2.6-like [Cordylochernes scorpioides]
MFKDSGMTLKVADGKNVTSIGRCTISLSINGLEQPLEFIVLPNSNPSIILGWDFQEASNAVIDCGCAEIRLEEAKDVLNSPASMGKVVARRSVVIPAESTKLINVMSEELNGQNQVLFEPLKKVLIGKGLTLPCALFRLSHNKGKLWIVNSSTTAQIVPKGMCLGKIQRVEENNLTAISECSEFNKEAKNANHASHADESDFKILQNLISDDLSEEQQSQILSILKRYDKIFDKNNEPVKQTSVTKHKIETGNHQPIKHRPYRVSPTERQAIQTEVDKMLDAGIIRHSESPWSSPVILVKKKDAELRLNPKKCLFGTKRIRVFGHLVDSKGIYPDPEKIEAIAKFPTPKSITDVRSFIGLCSYYRRFIENFAEKAAPLHEVLKKDNKFTWNSDQQDAFDSLKKALMSEPVPAYFEEQLPTELHTDASGYGIGAVLVQINDGKERPVGYASRTLSKAEKNYSTTERECLAAIWAINKFRPYLFGREFVIVTDHHALCCGRKHQDADCLSRNPLQLESEEAYNDEDDDIPSITALTCFEAEQRKDPKISKLIEETERFGAESKGYEMLKGTLYKKNFDPLGNQHLLVIPKHLRLELLRSLHDAPTVGHLGFSKTYERVKNKYFWPGLLRDIRKYDAHCKECQRKKQSTQKPPGLLKAIPPATSPFQRVGMDLLGRFPKSDTGNKWIIVCTDYLTRFAVTKALPTGEAKEAAKFLMEDVVLKHGAPREIITDRGRVFQSKLIAELANQCSSIHRFTTAYHPQTNGLTESVEQKDWDLILPYVTFAYNTAKQDTTGFTPFKLIHGREVETTVDTLFPNPHEDLQEDYNQKIASRVEETRQLARLETLKAQEKDKARYDSKHEAMDYNVGDLVWIFIPIRKVGLSEKLMKRYFGPYRVTRKLSDVTFEVEPVDQPTRRRQTRDLVHVLRMKPYHDPEDQADLFNDTETHELIKEAFGGAASSRSRTFEWFSRFLKGREKVNDDQHTGRPRSLRGEENKLKIKELIESKRISIKDLSSETGLSVGLCHQIVTKDLDMIRTSSKFVPRILTEEEKEIRMDVCKNMVEMTRTDPEWMQKIITGEETWVHQYDPETKRHSSQWIERGEQKPKKARFTKSKVKTLTFFILTVWFTINLFLVRLKRPERWQNNDWILHVDNTRPHTAHVVLQFLAKHSTIQITLPPYSPNYFFLYPKFSDDSEWIIDKTTGTTQHGGIGGIVKSPKPRQSHIEAFDNHFIGKRNVVYERALFGLRSQRPEETIEEFVTVLHRISEHCEYANLREELIRDRLVLGVKDRKLSEKLMLNENLTLAKAVEIARQWEAVMSTDVNPEREFPKLFEGLGLLEQPYHIKLKEGAKPFSIPVPRRVPLPLMLKLKEQLDAMVAQEVIEPVDEPTEWCAPIVLAGKPNGKIRICVDLSRLNLSVERELHPLAVLEHELAQLNGAKIFSRLDANSGFWQIKLSEESQTLMTFITPFGRYKFKRLPFGISSAPEHFQKRTSAIIRGVNGVICHMDDILIFAKRKEDHDETLREVLRRLNNSGITLNKEKCQFSVSNVTFLGHYIDEQGIKVDEKKVKAIAEMKPPADVHGVQRFMGMVNFLGRFVPNLAEITKPLNDLRKKDVSFIWGSPQKKAFEKVKDVLASDRVLGYAQIEKEALAITWACERFKDFVVGKTFLIETDHKPLVPIFTTKDLNDLTPRLQRYRMRMLQFSFHIFHTPGKDLITADALPRQPLSGHLPEDEELQEEVEHFVRSIVLHQSTTDDRLAKIALNQKLEPTLQNLAFYSKNGWPAKCQLSPLERSFYDVRDEIGEENGLLVRGLRVIIPSNMRKDVLNRIHAGIGQEIQDMVKTCEKCIENQPLKHEPLIPNDLPERPWQKVGMDLFHYEGTIFARHGIPDIVISDNGPQFRPSRTSAFTKFASEVGFRHITSSPKHPQSNGQAEAAVKIVENLKKKNKDPVLALMEYRAIPLANGLSPAELLFGRKIRTMVSCTSSSLTPKTVDQSKLRGKEEQRKMAQKTAFDRRHAATKKTELIAGEKVWVKDLRAWGRTYRRNSLLASSQQQVDPSETSDSELPAETEETPGNELPAEEQQQLPAIAPEMKQLSPSPGKVSRYGRRYKRVQR